MNKIFSILAIVVLSVSLKAVEIDLAFDKKMPAGVSVQGTVQQEDGASVLVNDKNYYVGIIPFDGEEGVGGTLEFELKSAGEPAGQLGIITDMEVLRSIAYENGKLKTVSMPTWMRKVPSDKYTKLTFNFKPGTFKAGQKYQIYFYRSNQKGTLKFKRVLFKTAAPAAK